MTPTLSLSNPSLWVSNSMQPPCVLLCDLTTCHSSTERAWFQHLILQCYKLLSHVAHKFNLRRYIVAPNQSRRNMLTGCLEVGCCRLKPVFAST